MKLKSQYFSSYSTFTRHGRIIMAVIASSLLGASSASAVVVALYDFEDQDVASNDADALSSAGDLSTLIAGSLTGNLNQNNAGLQIAAEHTDRQASGDSLTFGSPVTGFALAGQYGDIDRSSNLQHAIDNGFYLSFTITPGAGGQIDPTSLSMAMAITNGTADKYVGIFSSVGGFNATADAITTQIFDPAAAGGVAHTMDLSSMSPISAATEFRIYMVTNASTASHGFAVDNIKLEGTSTAIPEPTSLVLLMGGALLTAFRRRRLS